MNENKHQQQGSREIEAQFKLISKSRRQQINTLHDMAWHEKNYFHFQQTGIEGGLGVERKRGEGKLLQFRVFADNNEAYKCSFLIEIKIQMLYEKP